MYVVSLDNVEYVRLKDFVIEILNSLKLRRDIKTDEEKKKHHVTLPFGTHVTPRR